MNDLDELLGDKSVKPKDKVGTLSNWLLDSHMTTDELISFCRKSRAPVQAICLAALELATKSEPTFIDKNCFSFVANCLSSDSPAIKREAARVIANTAENFRKDLKPAIPPLIENAYNDGTVVRWSAATALAAIADVDAKHNELIRSHATSLLEKEVQPSIQKIYKSILSRR
jgi:hypothetical protein